MLSEHQKQCLDAIGITRWQRRDLAEAVTEPEVSASRGVAGMDWSELAEAVAQCTHCKLSETRTHTVFGAGDNAARWLIIGEAPGEQEDLQGLPFVGRAGVLLTNMLQAIGLDRDRVYIANVIKCRPPDNRDPDSEEIAGCLSYLHRQVALIQPSIILVVGRVAAQSLLDTTAPIGKMRGRSYQYPGTEIPLVVTYHPAYLLRRPSEKLKSWADLKLALSCVAEAP